MANSPIVTSLPNYVEEHREELIAKAVLTAQSADMFTLETGVKGPTALNLINTEVVFGDGSTCGWNEAGTTTLSQRILTPKVLKVNMAFCDKNLLSKWANYMVRIGAGKTESDLPFEKEFVDGILNQVNAGVEKMIYQGDSTATGATEFDGLIKILTETGSTAINVTAASNVSAYQFLKNIAAKIPAELLGKDDLRILVSMSLYNEFMQDLVAANLYHYNPGDGANEYMLPGTSIKVVAVAGLNDTVSYDYAIAGRLSNMFYGVDLQNEQENFDLWYSKDNQEFRIAIEFIAGVQVAYTEEIVLGKRTK